MSLVNVQNTLASQIYDQLKSRIIEGEKTPGTTRLLPGDALRTEDLARDFGVSHTPVREGLRLLERDGLVEHLPRRGVVVKQITPDQFREMFEARAALEAVTARGAAQHAEPEMIQQMKKLLHQASRSVECEDRTGHIRSDQTFHRLIAQASGNSIVSEMTEKLIDRFQMFFIRTTVNDSYAGLNRGHQEHLKILDAIEAGQPSKAEQYMVDHIESSRTQAAEQGWI